MNPLPPQAYTKDALQKAYAWLMNQPASIRELATTPDVLVSLFLKTQRDGMESLERPSIQNFRSELKQLAGMMSEFSDHDGAATMPLPPASSHLYPHTTPHHPPPPQTMMATPPIGGANTAKPSTPSNINAVSETHKMIQEVKDKLGFNTDQQALEALIRVGHHHLITRIFKV